MDTQTAPATRTDYDGDKTVSSLALKLEIAMACDPDARERYLAIWGEPWQPLVTDHGTLVTIRDANDPDASVIL